MRAYILASLFVFCGVAHSQVYPDLPGEGEQIDPQWEMGRLGSMDGVWEGEVELFYDPNGAFRDDIGKLKVRFTIQGASIKVENYDKNGKLYTVAAENYIYNVSGTSMVNTVNQSTAIIENYSYFLAHVDKNRIEGYVSRTVHHFNMVNSSVWRVIPAYGSLELMRIR